MVKFNSVFTKVELQLVSSETFMLQFLNSLKKLGISSFVRVIGNESIHLCSDIFEHSALMNHFHNLIVSFEVSKWDPISSGQTPRNCIFWNLRTDLDFVDSLSFGLKVLMCANL